MKRALKKNPNTLYHFKDGIRVDGPHDGIRGDTDLIYGDATGICGWVGYISGDVTGIRGDVSWISGNVSGISGYVTRVSGDLGDCGLTNDDRARGVDIEDLIIN